VKGDSAYQRSGYFRKHRWFKDTERLIAPGERREREPLENVYLETLECAVKLASTPAVKARSDGSPPMRVGWPRSVRIASLRAGLSPNCGTAITYIRTRWLDGIITLRLFHRRFRFFRMAVTVR
jgi:hypothetical protein